MFVRQTWTETQLSLIWSEATSLSFSSFSSEQGQAFWLISTGEVICLFIWDQVICESTLKTAFVIISSYIKHTGFQLSLWCQFYHRLVLMYVISADKSPIMLWPSGSVNKARHHTLDCGLGFDVMGVPILLSRSLKWPYLNKTVIGRIAYGSSPLVQLDLIWSWCLSITVEGKKQTCSIVKHVSFL